MSTVLYLVIPCYNEEEVLPETYKRLNEKMEALEKQGRIAAESRILFVNDGSKDATWAMISRYHDENPRVAGVCLSRNRGHQNALLAGLMTAKDYADAAISLDADLQDDIEAIDAFLTEYEKGAEIVYGVRSSRKTDTAFKRGTAQTYYRILNQMGVETVYNHADYRLMGKRSLEALAEYTESGLYLRGIVPCIGFRTATVEYERHERFAGTSKYPLKKMLNLASDGITAFSVKPLRMIFFGGVLLTVLSLAALLAILIAALCGGEPGGASVLASLIVLMGSLQLIALGIVGEYVGKINLESRNRPRYFISETLL